MYIINRQNMSEETNTPETEVQAPVEPEVEA